MGGSSEPGERVLVEILVNSHGTHQLPDDMSGLPLLTITALWEESLAALIDRANAATAAPSEHPRFMFCTLPSQGVRTVASDPDIVISEAGRMKWPGYPFSFEKTTLGDLDRAGDAGLFAGDTRTFILDQYITVGNGGFYPTWVEFLRFLKAAGEAGAGVTFLGGAALLAKRAAARTLRWGRQRSNIGRSRFDSDGAMRRLAPVLETGHETWITLGADSPAFFLISIAQYDRWDSLTLARLLAIDEAAVVILLETLGYERVREFEFRLSRDQRRRECRRLVLERVLHRDPLTGEAFSQELD